MIQLISLLDAYTVPEKFTDSLTTLDICFVTEYAGKSIAERLESGTRFKERDISLVVYQVLSALKHLHCELRVVHRVHILNIDTHMATVDEHFKDLSSSNVVVNDNCSVKIVDYGLARYWHVDSARTLYQYDTTLHYQAPELLCDLDDYDEKGNGDKRFDTRNF